MKGSLPGAVWVALILSLTGALSAWLTGNLSDSWVPLAVLALSMIAKAAEIYFTDKQAAKLELRAVGEVEVLESHKIQRFLLGG